MEKINKNIFNYIDKWLNKKLDKSIFIWTHSFFSADEKRLMQRIYNIEIKNLWYYNSLLHISEYLDIKLKKIKYLINKFKSLEYITIQDNIIRINDCFYNK